MTRFVCFDQPGTDAARAAGADATQRRGDALMAAVRESGNSVVIMPAGDARQLALISVIKREVPKAGATPAVASISPISRTATGFLGLTDEPEFADEPESKSWWKRWSS